MATISPIFTDIIPIGEIIFGVAIDGCFQNMTTRNMEDLCPVEISSPSNLLRFGYQKPQFLLVSTNLKYLSLLNWYAHQAPKGKLS